MRQLRFVRGWEQLRRLLVLACVWGEVSARGQQERFLADEPLVRVSTFWSHTGVRPGGQINLAVVLEIKAPYHINSNQAKAPFIPTRVELVDPPRELSSNTPIFPEPHEIDFGLGESKEKIEVFSDRTVLIIRMGLTDATSPGDLDLKIKVSYQACDDKQCLRPTDVTHTTKLPVTAKASGIRPANQELFQGMEGLRDRLNVAFFGWDFKFSASNLWLLLLVAAVGGFLLNLTPCVLPVVPLKIIGLARAAGNGRSKSSCWNSPRRGA